MIQDSNHRAEEYQGILFHTLRLQIGASGIALVDALSYWKSQ
jgi:hypothetical protein